MGLESGTYINDLVTTNPVGATDQKQYGDNHIRLIKATLKATFPNMAGALARVSAKSGGYTVTATDNTVLFNCTAALTLALTAAATLGNQHTFAVYANGFDVLIDPNGAETINGAATLTVPAGKFAWVWCNGTSFFAEVAAGVGANKFSGLQQLKFSADIASAATVDLGAVTGNSVAVTHSTGTTAITSLGGATLQKGTVIRTLFDISGGTLSLTHHATNLILPGGDDIVLSDNDWLEWTKMHDSNAEWMLTGGLVWAPVATQAEMEAGTEAGLRRMSPLRVAQAIAFGGGGGTMLYEFDNFI